MRSDAMPVSIKWAPPLHMGDVAHLGGGEAGLRWPGQTDTVHTFEQTSAIHAPQAHPKHLRSSGKS